MKGSFKTPLGEHRICARIGEGFPLMTVFKGRQAIGVYQLPDKHKKHNVYQASNQKLRQGLPAQSDWILTRILWLEGMETGKNCRGKVDTRTRYIYIHGTHDEPSVGSPVSHGCIRMCNKDMMELFKHTFHGERVRIRA